MAGSGRWTALTKTKLIGQAKLSGQALLCFATYNLVRTCIWTARLFEIHVPDAFREHFFNGLLGLNLPRVGAHARGYLWPKLFDIIVLIISIGSNSGLFALSDGLI